MKSIKKYSILACLLFLTACGTSQAIYNVADKTVVTNASAEKVRGAIMDAAAYKRWLVKEEEPGRLVLEIYVRSHYASISVDYDDSGYSITYLRSENLDHKGGTIHRNYNKWIKLLEMEIDSELRQIR